MIKINLKQGNSCPFNEKNIDVLLILYDIKALVW